MVDAREYHERTKHSPRSVRQSSFRLDPTNKPGSAKRYVDVERVQPTGPPDPPAEPALRAIANSTASPEASSATNATGPPDLHTLCHYATGVTKELEIQGRPMRFRAAACTGRLYHVDCYAVVGEMDSLPPGVYHFDPEEDAFDRLREGDYRGVLADATGGHPSVVDAPVTFVLTSQWWRNAWKYRERTYRHAFWDSGTILANLLAVAHAGGHRAEVVAAFADDPVAELIGVDPGTEAPLELVPVGSGDHGPDAPTPDAPAVDPIDPAEEPLSRDPIEYPILQDAWRQSALSDAAAATEWRDQFADDDASFGVRGPGNGETIDLAPVDDETASARPIGETIARRGSLREYAYESISDRKLATVLDRALPGVPTDCYGRGTDRLLEYYCLVHAVEGVPSGAYQYHPHDEVLERVGATDRETAGHVALDQPVVGDAAVNVYLLADVDRVVGRLGNRGYRLAQLEAGIGLGRLYLATYAHRELGGRGFTFYDDLVTEHLSPRAHGRTPMTLFALGKPA